MKINKRLLASSIVVSALSFGGLAPLANAEVGASVGIASTYLWRGFDLGSGTPAVSGDLNISGGGFTAGIWGSSGDTTAGTEYDLYAGFSGEAGNFSYGITIISYIYPTGQFSETDGPGDFMEAIISLGLGPISFNYHDNIAGDTGGYAFSEDYSYFNIGAAFGDFSLTVGVHDEGDFASVTGNSTHVDFSYAYNENLSFTYSFIANSDEGELIVIDEDTGELVPYVDNEPFFVVSYSIPIE